MIFYWFLKEALWPKKLEIIQARQMEKRGWFSVGGFGMETSN